MDMYRGVWLGRWMVECGVCVCMGVCGVEGLYRRRTVRLAEEVEGLLGEARVGGKERLGEIVCVFKDIKALQTWGPGVVGIGFAKTSG